MRRNVSLGTYSTFGIKTKARFFCEIKNERDVLEAFQWAKEKEEKIHVIAWGSNIVLPDLDISGLVLRISGGVIRRFGKGKFVADAGVPLARLIQKTTREGYKGIEALSGIPGTVGGAIRGNAGAYGESIADSILRVYAFYNGNFRWYSKEECAFSYRESMFKKNPEIIIVRAEFSFIPGKKEELIKKSKSIIKIRNAKFAPTLKCPGSYFKNVCVEHVSLLSLKKIPKEKIVEGKIPAGYLLESVGAKGMRCGGIYVSDFHGNIILNSGKGTSHDARLLAKKLKEKVKRKFGICLEEEVEYL